MTEIQLHKPLANLNTFGFDVKAARYIEFASTDDLKRLHARGVFETTWYVLGAGSNILFSRDYEGTLLHPVSQTITETARSGNTVTLRADAGVVWDDFVSYCVDNHLYGVENLAYIPGTVGASPVQNVGAYGREVKDVIQRVEVWLPEKNETLWLSAADCGFGYRDSIFKRELSARAIVVSVEFLLSTDGRLHLDYGDLRQEACREGAPSLQSVRDAVVRIRRAKLPEPSELGNTGSFFKNPVISREDFDRLQSLYPDLPGYPAGEGVKVPAGWLIDRAGWKGYRKGAAGVHSQQALVLVNHGGATGQDILELAAAITDDVRSKFGITIEKEVNVL